MSQGLVVCRTQRHIIKLPRRVWGVLQAAFAAPMRAPPALPLSTRQRRPRFCSPPTPAIPITARTVLTDVTRCLSFTIPLNEGECY